MASIRYLGMFVGWDRWGCFLCLLPVFGYLRNVNGRK